jgi:hypothetical protein
MMSTTLFFGLLRIVLAAIIIFSEGIRKQYRKFVNLFDGNEWAAIVWAAIGGAAFGVLVLCMAIELISKR